MSAEKTTTAVMSDFPVGATLWNPEEGLFAKVKGHCAQAPRNPVYCKDEHGHVVKGQPTEIAGAGWTLYKN